MKIQHLAFTAIVCLQACEEPIPAAAVETASLLKPVDTLTAIVLDRVDSSKEDTLSIPEFIFPEPPEIDGKIRCCLFYEMPEKCPNFEDLPAEEKPPFDMLELNIIACELNPQAPLQPAHFPGGNMLLPNYLHSHLSYPASCRKQGIEGAVFISFMVQVSGKISHLKVVRHLSPDADSVCVKTLRNMPLWKPAYQNDTPVASHLILPIRFSLSQDTLQQASIDVSELHSPMLFSSLADSLVLSGTKQQNKHFNQKTENAPELSVEVYPNPARTYCYLAVNQPATDMNYSIVDLKGNLIASELLSASDHPIDLSSYAPGNYVIQVSSPSLQLSESISLVVR